MFGTEDRPCIVVGSDFGEMEARVLAVAVSSLGALVIDIESYIVSTVEAKASMQEFVLTMRREAVRPLVAAAKTRITDIERPYGRDYRKRTRR